MGALAPPRVGLEEGTGPGLVKSGSVFGSQVDFGAVPLTALEAAHAFLLVGQLLLAAAALLATARVGPEGALTHERGAAGVEGGRHAALLLPALLPLQTGGEGTADCVAQPLTLVGSRPHSSLCPYIGFTVFI